MEYISGDHVKETIREIASSYSNRTKYSTPLIDNLEEIEEILTSHEDDYLEAAKKNLLHELKPVSSILSLTKTEMNHYYADRFKKEYSDRCYICDFGLGVQLDHVLPKDFYIQYTVTPCNLVPLCPICNPEKGIKTGDSPETNILHPYFDEINFKDFLKANLNLDNDIIEVYIGYELTSDSLNSKRHFYNYNTVFNLYKPFNALANRELRGFLSSLKKGEFNSSEFVKSTIKSQVDKLEERDYIYIGEEFIKYLVLSSLNENYDKEIHRILTCMINNS